MAKIVLAICDEEKNYSERLYEYIHGKENGQFSVILFTDYEQCLEYSKTEAINILLISLNLYNSAELKISASNIIILTGSKSESSDKEAYIYKYQSADKIFKKVMAYCSQKNSSVIRRNCKKPLSVIGVYSPIKKTFQTTFAVTLGQILAKEHKTIYLNFESFSGFDSIMSSKSRADLMDLLYFWSCGTDNFTYRLESVIEHIGNMDYVPPVHSFMNFEGINAKQWLGFIEAFEEFTDYEYLILDLSENVNGLFDILRICSRVYTLTDNKRISTAKLSQYEALLHECSYSDVIDKTQKMTIPLFREIPGNYEQLPYSDLARYIRRELEFEERLLSEPSEIG